MKRPTPYPFAAECAALLRRLGACDGAPSAGYAFTLPTKAGPLYLRPDDSILFTRFEFPERAALTVPCGSLNEHSGKWNWTALTDHPGTEFLAQIETALRRIVTEREATQ